MFTIAAIAYLVFLGAYVLFSAAILYHLRQYTLPDQTASRTAISTYVILSVLFFGIAAFYLFQIPTSL
jgi:hypothetical protein